MLCKQIIISIVYELMTDYEDYLEYKEYLKKINISNIPNIGYVFLGLYHKGDRIYASCIQITHALSDYLRLYEEITSNIATNKKDFRPPSNPYFHIRAPEIIKLCERTKRLKEENDIIDRERQIHLQAEHFLLTNKPSGMLGYTVLRAALEGCFTNQIQHKIRQNVRGINSHNTLNVKFTSNFKTQDILYIVEQLIFPRESMYYDAIDKIYGISNESLHSSLKYPSYISRGVLSVIQNAIWEAIDNLNPNDLRLSAVITKLENEKKISMLIG
jgi:hypothetical protein